MRILIGTTVALSITLCTLEYGVPLRKFVFYGNTTDSDRWLEEDFTPVTLRLPEPPAKEKPRVISTASFISDILVVDKIEETMAKEREFTLDIEDVDALFTPETTIEPDFRIYDIVEMYPEFPGGQVAMFQFLEKRLIFPLAAKNAQVQGTVMVKFVVDPDGTVRRESIEIIQSPHQALSAEAKRVVALFPKWIPGMQNGKSVAVEMKLPIRFTIR